ncbi:MAG: iron ABC transporter permease [Planctomycetota bacterium]
MRRGLPGLMVTALLLTGLALVLLAPIGAVVRPGFTETSGYSLVWFREIAEEFRLDLAELRQDVRFALEAESAGEIARGLLAVRTRNGLTNSVLIGLFTTLLCLIIAVPLALLSESYRFPGKRGWLALIQVPMVLPPFVGAIGIKGLLSRNGGINLLLAHWGLIDPADPVDWLAYPFWSVIVLEALYLYPITFLNVQAALANIDPALDEAARNLGAGAWRRFWRITLPLMRPGVFAGSTIVFIWAFTELGTPLMVNFREVAAVQVFDDLMTTNPRRQTYALVVVLLCASVLLYLLGKLVLGRGASGMMAKATVATPPRKVRPLGAVLVTLPFAAVFTVAVLPHVAVILVSISATGIIELGPDKVTLRYHGQLLHDLWASISGGGDTHTGLAALSIVNSFKYSLWATGADLVLGFAIAYLVVRRRSWLTAALDGLAMLPLAVPGLVLAFGYFVLTQGDAPFSFLNPLRDQPGALVSGTGVLLVIAYSVRRLPFLVRSCAAGLEQTSVALEESAINLGAGTLRTLALVTVPLLTANFIAGGLLVFSRSMLEVSDSLMLAFDRQYYPMTKAIYELADNPNAGLQMASALGVWGMLILIITISGASLVLGKRLGGVFRV